MSWLKNTFWLFLAFVSLFMVLPYILGIFRMGSDRVGFPLRFFERTSAPPPAASSIFSGRAFAIDLLVYVAAALIVLAVWEGVRRGLR